MNIKSFLKICLAIISINFAVTLLLSIMFWKIFPYEYFLGLFRLILGEISIVGIIFLGYNFYKPHKKGE